MPVKDEEHWKDVTSRENRKVTIVDLYYPWFGRCDVLDEALRGIYMNMEDPDKKIQYLNLDLTKIQVFKDLPKPSAKPHFRIYLVILQLLRILRLFRHKNALLNNVQIGWTNEG